MKLLCKKEKDLIKDVRGRFSTNWLNIDHAHDLIGFGRRKLCINQEITDKLQAPQLWQKGITGSGVKVAVFDTGLSKNHPDFSNIKEIINFTEEPSAEDGLGHGTFVAGLIASKGTQCKGFAPEAELYIFKVFTNQQVSYTSWFLDAFNYALLIRVNILNLSIGGPDYLDRPFVEKVNDLTAHGIILVSAIGNDGPLYGTLNNPADLSNVIGVGGIDDYDHIAKFSSRGVTTLELGYGYGRVKPDIVTYSSRIRGAGKSGGCSILSGTSVACPVITGSITLLASALPEEKRWKILNPASMKQIIIESADRLKHANMYEQGAGKLDLLKAHQELLKYTPKVSFFPTELDFTKCPYSWPFCTQPIYYSAMPLIFNATLLNGMGPLGNIIESPKWIPGTNGDVLNVKFTYSETLWPWSGHIALHIEVDEKGKNFEGIAEGSVQVTVSTPSQNAESTAPMTSTATLKVKVKIIKTPPRSKRILWDQYHNIQYPPGYIPRDNLNVKDDILDWNGDHIHTNFKDLYDFLRSKGYYIEILTKDFTQFDARNYGTLLLVDPEEEYEIEERNKLKHDVHELGLSIAVFADWYNPEVIEKIKFFDDNTHKLWTPITGGCNVPALNGLLEPFGIAFGNKIYDGMIKLGENKANFASGTSIMRFPKNGMLVRFKLKNQIEQILRKNENVQENAPVLGFSYYGMGRISVFGDSSCLDSSHASINCFWLLERILEFTNTGSITNDFRHYPILRNEFLSNEVFPQRIPNSGFEQYSKANPHNIVSATLPSKYGNNSRGYSGRKTLTSRSIKFPKEKIMIPVLFMFVVLIALIYMSIARRREILRITEQERRSHV